MKISLKWLSDYVDVKEFSAKPEVLAERLTAVGLEVEALENPAKSFANVVVGHIVELGRHPNADKLTLCQVDVGDGKPRQIVCGAKNHKAGDKVVVALPGAVLPGDFAIKLSKIRDVESQGMLCSESELGFKEESEGILILPSTAKVGMAFAEHADLQDVVFEINVTPNRADCLSHIGLAREISCLTEKNLKLPVAEFKTGAKKTKDLLNIELKNNELCPRYAGRAVFGVKVAPSPAWLKKRLESVGLNSVNNIVDVTNFVMMEYGQPLHAFDVKELRGQKIIIALSEKNEKFKSFDGTEFTLTGEELTIRDAERPVALAGVVGSLNSGVTESTTDIFIEAAHFNPRGVRRTSRRHGVHTDSAQRFSRGTDPENVVEAMNRAAQLIEQVAGGEIAKDHYDLYPSPEKRTPIKVRKSILEARLGYPVDFKNFVDWMNRLHCKTQKITKTKTDEEVLVEAPPFRFDLEMEMDLVEEYGRLNGYDKIPEAFPALEKAPTDSAVNFVQAKMITDLMVSQSFYEVKNYNFVSPKWQNELFDEKIFSNLGLSSGGEAVNVKNPLSEETAQMRRSLLPGVLTNALHNYRYGMTSGKIFEVGYVFGKKNDYVESHRLAGASWGQDKDLWQKADVPAVFSLKSAVEGVAAKLKVNLVYKKMNQESMPAFIHPGQVASFFFEGQMIGFLGALHPAFREEHKLRDDAAVFEINLQPFLRGQPRLPKVKPLSRQPAVSRDFALVVPNELAISDVLKEIEKVGSPLLQSAKVFDVFVGAGVPEGHRSIAVRVVLQDENATLSDEALNQYTQKTLEALANKFQIKPR